MQVSDTEDPVPLLKDKKPRPPLSEKQKANFEKARQVRAENIKAKKEEKILEAQRALLAKEGKLPAKEVKAVEQVEDEQLQTVSKVSPSKAVLSKPIKQEAQKTSAKPLLKEEKKKSEPKIKAKAPVVIEDSSSEEDEDDSSSEEEIIVVKRKKKGKPAKSAPRVSIQEDYNPSASDDEYNGCGRPKASSSFHDYFV